MSTRNDRLRKALQATEQRLEHDFREERADAAAHFHNAINDVIADQAPTVETILYVFEMVRWELMQQRHDELFAPASKVTVVHHEHDDEGDEHSNGKVSALGIGIA